jgi:acetyl-CoA carboxylase beta subunit
LLDRGIIINSFKAIIAFSQIFTKERGVRRMSERNEIVIVPEAPAGGFMCPSCMFTTTSKMLVKRMNYCPDCGLHIKISTREFDALKKLADDLTFEQKEKCCIYYSIIGPEATHEKRMGGIYKKRLEDLHDDLAPIKGQMHLRDFVNA